MIVFADGTYTLAAGQVANKVIVKWYRQDGNNLTYVSDSTDGAPAGGTYKTNSWNADIKNNQNVVIQWTVVAKLWVDGPGPNGAANPVEISGGAIVSNFVP